MFLGSSGNSSIYQRAFDEFVGELTFYVGEVRDYLVDLSMPERVLGLCIFILFVIYLIFARARRKYNPGSIGRQFVGAMVLVGIVVLFADISFDHTAGAYRSWFEL